MKGNWGKVLLVDLTKGTTEDHEIPEKVYRDYLGGSGLAAKWLFDRKGWEVDPLSPDNPMMIMLGPLSGLNLPGASRLEFCARSPLTGIWGEACMGGHFAPQLKATGYDGIIVYGASDKPVYLYVTDDAVEIRDASHLWGKDSFETEDLLKEEVGDKRAQVVSIGQGGENLVRYACVMNDKGSTAGRTGMGAVMGSKKLKAVVARGKKKPLLADEETFKDRRAALRERLKFSLVAEGLGAFGSNVHMEYGMAIGDVPTKNWTKAYWPNAPEKMGGATVAETRLTKTHSCYGCPIGCKRIVEVKSGPFAMEEGPGPEYEAAVTMGPDILVDDLDANLKANELCNRYGIDVISTGSTIAWAIEAYEKGVLTDKETGGMKLAWGDPDMLVELVEKIAGREGVGDILAEGTRAASQKYGGTEFAIHVKGMECPMHDPRALWGMALTYATSIRGACHCADANLYAEMGLFTHKKEQGIGRAWPFRIKNKAAQTVGSQVVSILSNSLVMCEYVETAAFNQIQDTVDLVNAATGLGYDLKSMIDTAHRIWYIKRAFGNLCGATRDDDQVPKRIIEPHLEGPVSSLNMALYPTYITMFPITWFFTNEKIMKIATPVINLMLPALRILPGFKEVQDIHGLYEKLMGMTAGMANAFLFPNINKILRALRFLPGMRAVDPKAPEAVKRTVPFQQMLEEFYRIRDIDQQGRPSRSKLESLGMKEVADALHE